MTSALRTIIVGGDADSTSLLKGLLASTSAVLVVGEFERLSQALQDGPARRPDLVIVELDADEATGPDGPPAKVVEALTRAFPDATVFATGPSVSVDFVIQAIRAGAVEFLRRPVQRDDLSAALEKLLRLRRASEPPARAGRITSVFSTKGGLGVTTLATNLAVCLAERSPGRAILIDLDTRQSDIVTFLNLRQTYSVLDVLENLSGWTSPSSTAFSSSTPVASGCSPDRPASSGASFPPSASRPLSRSSDPTSITWCSISGTTSIPAPSRPSRLPTPSCT